jgi:hypothetical protein
MVEQIANQLIDGLVGSSSNVAFDEQKARLSVSADRAGDHQP